MVFGKCLFGFGIQTIFRGRDVRVPRKPSWRCDDRRIRRGVERRRTAKLTLLFHLTMPMHSLEPQVNLSRKPSAVQKSRYLLSKTGFPKQCLHIFYLQKVSNIFTQKRFTSRYSVFGLCTVDLEVRSRTCHFGTDKRCGAHFICKRCHMSVGELAKGRCTWHVEW